MGSFQCVTCGVTCDSCQRLLEHIRRAHTGVRPFRCRHCHLRFICELDRRRHEVAHTRTSGVECPQCHARYKNQLALGVHVARSHSANTGKRRGNAKAAGGPAALVKQEPAEAMPVVHGEVETAASADAIDGQDGTLAEANNDHNEQGSATAVAPVKLEPVPGLYGEENHAPANGLAETAADAGQDGTLADATNGKTTAADESPKIDVKYTDGHGLTLSYEHPAASMNFGAFREVFGIADGSAKRIIFKKPGNEWAIIRRDDAALPVAEGRIEAQVYADT